ncbi:MAG: ribonuclease III [Candidatus Berkiella sp.]
MTVGKRLDVLERALQYEFSDKSLLMRALTHKSAHHQHNERFEFLGDAILNCVIADLLFSQFTDATEGELTRARASLVNQSTLSQVAQEMMLGDYLRLGMGEQKSGGFRRDSILADALEAILGSIYLDKGFDSAYECIRRWYDSRLANLKPNEQEKDPKTQLQEWLQANQKSLPRYQVVAMVGEPHSQIFTVVCEIEELSLIVEGQGTSRRIAEQAAARKILEKIK